MTNTLNVGPLATVPPVVTQGTPETIPWGIDMTNAISQIAGAVVSNPITTLTDVTRSPVQPVTLADAPVVMGNVVEQIIRGSVLTSGHTYQLEVTFSAAVVTELTVVMIVVVPI